MDDTMDAAGQAAALGEDIVAELKRDVSATQPEQASATESQSVSGAQSVEEARSLAKEGFAEFQHVLDEQREAVPQLVDRQEMARKTDVEERIARIKAGLAHDA